MRVGICSQSELDVELSVGVHVVVIYPLGLIGVKFKFGTPKNAARSEP